MTDRDLFYCIHQSMLIDHLAADVADGHTCRRRTGVKGRVLTASQSPSAQHTWRSIRLGVCKQMQTLWYSAEQRHALCAVWVYIVRPLLCFTDTALLPFNSLCCCRSDCFLAPQRKRGFCYVSPSVCLPYLRVTSKQFKKSKHALYHTIERCL